MTHLRIRLNELSFFPSIRIRNCRCEWRRLWYVFCMLSRLMCVRSCFSDERFRQTTLKGWWELKPQIALGHGRFLRPKSCRLGILHWIKTKHVFPKKVLSSSFYRNSFRTFVPLNPPKVPFYAKRTYFHFLLLILWVCPLTKSRNFEVDFKPVWIPAVAGSTPKGAYF